MDSKKREFAPNIGISSILFIFVVLCLVSFATLSLSSAMSDQRLSKKVLSHSEAYFDACNEAEELLASFDATLASFYGDGISRAGYFEKAGKKKLFAVPITEIQTLEVEIEILYPEKSGDPFMKITRWQSVTTGDLEYDDSINVFK